VYFPWPHLLFGDDVWRAFYRKAHDRDETFSWVNKLTYAQYLTYFDMLGFRQKTVWLTPSTFDADFYARFEDVLSRYPRFDLSHDFVYAVLERPEVPIRGAEVERRQLRTEVERLDRELTAMRESISWRVTAAGGHQAAGPLTVRPRHACRARRRTAGRPVRRASALR
jgi:hypothetical protein